MNVTFSCPRCERSARVELDTASEATRCPHCQTELVVPPGAIEAGEPTRCLICPSTDLFVRKDFPQRLGVAIVVLGFVASSIAWYDYRIYLTFGILCATASLDVVLYVLMGENLTCYRCGAQYRGLPGLKHSGAFDLSVHERYRQQAARLARKS